jgi:hypothetical protein
MPTHIFPGGSQPANGDPDGSEAFWYDTNWYAEQSGVEFPNGRVSIDGSNYPIKVININPDDVVGSTSIRLIFDGTSYSAGSIINTDGSNGNCSIRITKTGGTTAGFDRTNDGATPKVTHYRPNGAVYATWNGQMMGYWTSQYVPDIVSSISVSASGTSATVTRGTATDATSYSLQRSDSADGSTWGSWGNTQSNISTTYTYTNLTPGRYYRFRAYGVNDVGSGAGRISSTIQIENIPAAPVITSVTKTARKITLNWSAPPTGTPTSYVIQSKYSSDGGATWETSYSTIATLSASTFTYTTADLLIAKTYKFAIYATSAVGNSGIAESANIFISAYGYRKTGNSGDSVTIGGVTNTGWKAIELAARYTGNPADSVTVGGVTNTGWKQIESVKRYNGTSWIDLVQ